MFREQRKKFYRKNRFKPWYRKINHYIKNRKKIDKIIYQFKGQLPYSQRIRLRLDMIWSLFRYGAYFSEYFLFGFEGMPHAYRDGFITEAIRLSYYPRMNSPKNTDLIENKFRAYKKFKDMYRREILCVRSKDEITPELICAYEDFASRNSTYIVKPIYAAFGKGVHKDSLSNHPSALAALEHYHEHGAVLEEYIIQAPGMSVLHPASVNTLRIPTAIVNDSEGQQQVLLFHPSLRVGHSGSLTDNLSAGGISALIDPESGTVYTDGADKKGHRFPTHPDTGVRFMGFKIPEWDKAVAMAKEAALQVPGNNYCGWDLAYGEKGWCLVEANSTAQMGAMQLVTQTGRKKELEHLISLMKKD